MTAAVRRLRHLREDGGSTVRVTVTAGNGHGPMVDNPWRQQLVALKRDLHEEMHELTGLLKKPCADVAEGTAWVGPTADTWHAEAEGRRSDILAQLRRLIPLVEAEIGKCEEKVTVGEAKSLLVDLL